MKIIGTTSRGHRITQHHGGITRTETDAERDVRRETEAYELVRNTAPELLQACKGLLAIIPDLECSREDLGYRLTSGEQQAIDYATAIMRKLDPSYGVEQVPPVTGDNLA